MARRSISNRKAGAEARVYKASDVHKRRIDRNARPEAKRKPAPEVPAEEEPQREPGRTQFMNFPEVLPETEPSQPAVEQTAGERSADAPAKKAEVDQAVDQDAKVKTGKVAQVPLKASSKGESASDAADEAVDDTQDAASKAPTVRRVRSKVASMQPSKLRIAIIIVAVVAVVTAVVAGAWYWNRVLRFDDHADLQGTWYIAGSTATVTIDENSIHLTDDTAYEYTIDEAEKTIDVSLGLMEGKSYYEFSDDRQSVVISENGGYGSAINSHDLPVGDGIIALSREPSTLAVICKQVGDFVAPQMEAAEEQARIAAEEAEEEEDEEVY